MESEVSLRGHESILYIFHQVCLDSEAKISLITLICSGSTAESLVTCYCSSVKCYVIKYTQPQTASLCSVIVILTLLINSIPIQLISYCHLYGFIVLKLLEETCEFCISMPIDFWVAHYILQEYFPQQFISFAIICFRVCKKWSRILTDKSLWRHVDLRDSRLCFHELWGIIIKHFTQCVLTLKIRGNAFTGLFFALHYLMVY